MRKGCGFGCEKGAMTSPIQVSTSFCLSFFRFILHVLLFTLLLPSSSSRLHLVDVLAADDLVSDPVENVKNEEDEREGHARHRVDALGPADEQLLHLLDAPLGRGPGRGVVVVAFDGHAVLGLQAGGAHAVTGEAEASLARLVFLQHRPRLRLLGTRERGECMTYTMIHGEVYDGQGGGDGTCILIYPVP